MQSEHSHRLATQSDIPAIAALMERAMTVLQRPFLGPDQIDSSRAAMGLDSQLIADDTYFVIEQGGRLAGCGGWSRRTTLYGGEAGTVPRDARLLDPKTEPARIRAMYTDPDFARQGVGRLILALCEAAALAEGFTRAEMMATLAGEPLYAACGYVPIERVARLSDAGEAVPGVRMAKMLSYPPFVY